MLPNAKFSVPQYSASTPYRIANSLNNVGSGFALCYQVDTSVKSCLEHFFQLNMLRTV
ncbi:hypothetical protein ACVWW6_000581 [Bradyrhizobium sp. USDA 3311]